MPRGPKGEKRPAEGRLYTGKSHGWWRHSCDSRWNLDCLNGRRSSMPPSHAARPLSRASSKRVEAAQVFITQRGCWSVVLG
jgi:hypothetical protein